MYRYDEFDRAFVDERVTQFAGQIERRLDGRLTGGTLLVVVAYLAAVYEPISEIARTTGLLQQAVVSARRVREILGLSQQPTLFLF